MRSALPILMLLCLGGSAQARAFLPIYDLYSYCSERVPFGSTGVDGVLTCIDDENLEASALAAHYASIREDLRSRCEASTLTSTKGFGAYSALTACIDSERLKHVPQPPSGFGRRF